MNSQNNPFLTAALDYAERFGFSVIPCRPDKKPFLKWESYQNQKISLEEIKEWHPQYGPFMIGIVTGEISGLLVIDCDTREGYESIQELLPDSLIVPTARTPRGGWHLYFLYPKDSKLTVGAGILPGVDFRGQGGYVIAPPSQNGEGKAYTWENGLSLDEVEPPAPPDALLNILINNSLYRGGEVTSENNRLQVTSLTSSDFKMFVKGRRDEDLFHIANCLIKGHAKPEEAYQVLNLLARNSKPPFPENEIKAKINSAIQRAEKREINFAAEVRDFVVTSNGFFLTSDVFNRLQVTSRQGKKNVVLTLLRLQKEGIIERHGQKDGCYRRVETDIEPVNFLTASTDEFSIVWPLEIHKHCVIYPGNIVIVAGSKSAGKTAFLLNIVKLNMRRSEIVYLNSEMGDTEFRKRLELFEDVRLTDWNLKAYHRTSNFSDLITSERKTFIVDFLEVTSDFWKVAQYIQEIHKKLNEGICIIALQKSEAKDTGRGGDFSKEKARLYLSLDYLPEQKINQIKIIDAKAWRTHENPRGKYRRYKLVQGSKYLPMGEWIG
jgi:hypothetical protein